MTATAGRVQIRVGELAVESSRFRAVYLQVGDRRVRLLGADCTWLGHAIAETGRSAVSRVDLDTLNEITFECEAEVIETLLSEENGAALVHDARDR